MLDSGAEVNVITRKMADALNLLVWTDMILALRVITSDSRRFDGVCEDVEVDIGRVVNY